MDNSKLFTGLFLLLLSSQSFAQNLYQVTLLRAAPGNMPALIEQVKAEKQQLEGELVIMRHSQGDHWDLMLMSPGSDKLAKPVSYGGLADFQHDFVVTSKDNWSHLKKRAKGNNLFHIEMFRAQHGQYNPLLKQRQMENDYYLATERQPNLIFETVIGTDFDMFTLGIYKDLKTFATDPDLPAERFEKAATDAGFKSRSDIGFYLRGFLIGHQDTLASQIE